MISTQTLRKPNEAPDKEAQFTGGKTPEYAIFYNLAYSFMNNMLQGHFDDWGKPEQWNHQTDAINNFAMLGFNCGLPDSAYLKIRNYLWKGYTMEKNSSGEILTVHDKKLVIAFIVKLLEIRNFHSHVWHDNSCLIFDTDLAGWIQKLHDMAVDSLRREFPREINEYELAKRDFKLFDQHDGLSYITQEGRNFFLSFFLKKSEMTRFMQHRRGCKRNDKPEFMIKHRVYRYYTHRDGATKNHYSVEETAFSKMDIDSQNEIKEARRLLQQVNYLNDVPSEASDPELFPLYLNNQPVETATELLVFIQQKQLFKQLKFSKEMLKSGVVKNGELSFKINGEGYSIKTGTKTMHRLILDCLRDPNREMQIMDVVNRFVEFRDAFPTVLNSCMTDNKGLDTLIEYATFKMKGHPKLSEKLNDCIERLSAGKTLKADRAEKLLLLVKTSPIELNYYDFYFEMDQKPRSSNQFLSIGVNYLIDHDILPDVEWLTEKFESETELKKRIKGQTVEEVNVLLRKKSFAGKIPDDARLCITDGHVMCRLKSEPAIKFNVGEKAMRNLLIAQLQRKHPVFELFQRMSADINLIKQAAKQGTGLKETELSLLSGKTLPRYLKLMMQNPETLLAETLPASVEHAKKRMKLLLVEFKKMQNGDVVLSKKEINTQLIRCYKYFDWKYEHNSEFKFLRQNEYQQMSIYHYTLDMNDYPAKTALKRKWRNPPSDDQLEYERKKAFRFLRQRLFVDIDMHLPDNLRRMLEQETHLDSLFSRVLAETIRLFEQWLLKIDGMKAVEREIVLRKLGIHVPEEPVPTASNTKNLKQAEHLPFAVHPDLIFEAFYEGKNPTGSFRNSTKFANGLIESHYNYKPYLNWLSNEDKLQHKQGCTVIGQLNEVRVSDMVLLEICKRYLLASQLEVFRDAKQLLDKNDTFEINQLHQQEVPLCRSDKNDERPFVVKAKYKQLGDYMLITEEKTLRKVVLQLFKRFSEAELEAKGIEKTEGVYQLPYIEIKQEMERIFHEALMLTDMLLDWEKEVVAAIPANEKKQLIYEAQNSNDGKKAYIPFAQVCAHAGLSTDDAEKLKNLRNYAMHSKIPKPDWTYRSELNSDRIKKILNITDEKLKKYENKSAIYEALALQSGE